MGKTHYSMRGRPVDLEKLGLKNELTPAVGNIRVNARGDGLGTGGKIVRTREEILKDYYAKNPRAVQEEVAATRSKGKK